MKTPEERASEWWAERYEVAERREDLRKALLKHLPKDEEWITYCDYEPEGILYYAMLEFADYKKDFFDLIWRKFPLKTGIRKAGDRLFAKDGYGADWIELL